MIVKESTSIHSDEIDNDQTMFIRTIKKYEELFKQSEFDILY